MDGYLAEQIHSRNLKRYIYETFAKFDISGAEYVLNLIVLMQIGQGTYSSVYKARDLTNNKVVALKRVRFDNMDPESVKFMAREILILRRLDHPNIIKLEGMVTSRTSCSLYLVFEYMEHDLTGLASLPGAKFTEPQVDSDSFFFFFSSFLDT